MGNAPTPKDVEQQCRGRSWLLGDRASDLQTQFQQVLDARHADVQPWIQAGALPTVAIADDSPAAYLASFLAACQSGCPVVLGNPKWAIAEWQTVLDVAQPTHVWGAPPPLALPTTASPLPPGWILIPTGGTSGQLRFAIHTWATLMAAAVGFQQHFHCQSVKSCCLLPLYHVSGLMQAMRVWQSQGQLAIATLADLMEHGPQGFDPQQFFISLVPTQLQRLLDQPSSSLWLSQFRAILLGGAPAWSSLLDDAQNRQIPIALTYGMTETAAQVATLQPQRFLQGDRSCGPALPHCAIAIVDDQGQPLPRNQPGRVVLRSSSQCLGYLPASPDWEAIAGQPLLTEDLGYLTSAGDLHLVGRRSHTLITGGENVAPEEVEAAIRSTGLVADIGVVGLPDHQWGEAVTAVYVPTVGTPTEDQMLAQMAIALRPHLSRFKHPKYWISVDRLPRTAQEKLQRADLKAIAHQWMTQHATPKP